MSRPWQRPRSRSQEPNKLREVRRALQQEVYAMSCEQEFRNVRDELSELQVHLVGDAGRDRHE